MTYASIKKTFGIQPQGWNRELRCYLYKILVDLFSFSLREVDPSSQSESSEEPTDQNDTNEACLGNGGLPKVKERCKAKVTVWKEEIEVATHLTKLIKQKDGYKSPVILSLLLVKDKRVVGIKLSFFDTDTANENTGFFPITIDSHPTKDVAEDIKEVVQYFIQRKPHAIFKFFVFNSEKKLFLRRIKENASDIIAVDLWNVIPTELMYLWDFYSMVQAPQSQKNSPLLSKTIIAAS